MVKFSRPKVLKEGSLIGISAASSSFLPEKFEKGVKILKNMGFRVKFSQDIVTRKKGYLAGSDDERAAELSAMLSDPEVQAIMFARGGYGVQRILPYLDFSEFKKNPKLVIGYSDLTALTSYITSKLETVCLYGPVVTALAENNETTISSLHRALTSENFRSLEGTKFKILRPGEAKGKLVGGCLSLLSSSIGTSYDLNTDGAILFIEDENEKIYKYDRMLTHLKNCGMFKKVKGIVFGPMGLVGGERSDQLWKVLKELLDDFDGPILAGLSSGHTSPFLTLPLGVDCTLSTDKPGLAFYD
jgi:muramoyltetrapeptide carboxypeptidase